MNSARQTLIACAAALGLVAACDRPDREVEPLPAEDRPSLEARAGLPEIEGPWRFAGLDLPLEEAPEDVDDLVAFRGLDIRTQRLDSIAGMLLTGNGPRSFVGEVRRDGVISLYLPGGEASGFAAGHVTGDTVWMSFTNVAENGWPGGMRLALLREPPRRPFIRLADGRMVGDPAVDTLPPLEERRPGERAPVDTLPARPDAPRPPAERAEPRPAEPRPTEPRPTPEPAPPAEPEPEPEPQPEPEPPPERERRPILGEPVRPPPDDGVR